jgi:cytoskeletal protein CcmA (bactofilin family)
MSDPTLPIDAVPRAELELGPETEFEGLVLLHGPTRIEGRIRGEIRSEDRVWLGPDARVEGRIDAVEVVVEGAVEGDLRASRSIKLRPSARMRGSLESPRLQLDEGSQLEGRCAMDRLPENDSGPAECDSDPSSP